MTMGRVLDRNACRSCRRPIQKLAGIGWVHGELPQYAHEQPTCDNPVPVDARCPFCGQQPLPE
jgi:RNA polymerase subunit RPABC4/transcription elongation factor Spt4